MHLNNNSSVWQCQGSELPKIGGHVHLTMAADGLPHPSTAGLSPSGMAPLWPLKAEFSKRPCADPWIPFDMGSLAGF